MFDVSLALIAKCSKESIEDRPATKGAAEQAAYHCSRRLHPFYFSISN
jgi:hypothetical protein